jgi:hypothetical protein
LLGGQAGWVTGNATTRKLIIHRVDAELNYAVVVLD